MSVLKRKREKSSFEVFHHYYMMRKEITNLLIKDFGFSKEKNEEHVLRQIGKKNPENFSDSDKRYYNKVKQRDEAFDDWFIFEERETILNYLRYIGLYIFSANNIYPQYMEELKERRLEQEKALGYCVCLEQELQYIIETLPVDVNKYLRFSDMIEDEIKLIKAWRKSDNRFKKLLNDEKKPKDTKDKQEDSKE